MKKWEKIYKTNLIHNFEEFGEQGYEEWVEYADFEELSLEELAEEWFEWDRKDQPVLIKARKGEILIQKMPKEWEVIKVKIIDKKGKEKLTTLGELYKKKKINEIWNWFLRRLISNPKLTIEKIIEWRRISEEWNSFYAALLTMFYVDSIEELTENTIERMIEILKHFKIEINDK